MKAMLFAVVLLLSVPSLFAQTPLKNTLPHTPPPTTEVAQKINMNKATAAELAGSFMGIGQKRAEAIVKYREAHGGFKAIDELANVRGMGKSFVTAHLAALKARFVLE